jgi:hypothetical protein
MCSRGHPPARLVKKVAQIFFLLHKGFDQFYHLLHGKHELSGIRRLTADLFQVRPQGAQHSPKSRITGKIDFSKLDNDCHGYGTVGDETMTLPRSNEQRTSGIVHTPFARRFCPCNRH